MLAANHHVFIFLGSPFCCSLDLLFFYGYGNTLKIMGAVLSGLDYNSVSYERLF